MSHTVWVIAATLAFEGTHFLLIAKKRGSRRPCGKRGKPKQATGRLPPSRTGTPDST